MTSSDFLAELEGIIAGRFAEPGETSYTSELARAGTLRIAQKVGEEGVETALAAAAGSRDDVLAEAADLVYHLLVLLADQELTLGDVTAELERRHRDA